MAKKIIDSVPVNKLPNVSVNDPSNANLNEYSKQKIQLDIAKKEKKVKKLEKYISSHDLILEQQKKDLQELTLDLDKLKCLEKMLF